MLVVAWFSALHPWCKRLNSTWTCLCRFVCVAAVLWPTISFAILHSSYTWTGASACMNRDIHLFICALDSLDMHMPDSFKFLLVKSWNPLLFIHDHPGHLFCSSADVVELTPLFNENQSELSVSDSRRQFYSPSVFVGMLVLIDSSSECFSFQLDASGDLLFTNIMAYGFSRIQPLERYDLYVFPFVVLFEYYSQFSHFLIWSWIISFELAFV